MAVGQFKVRGVLGKDRSGTDTDKVLAAHLPTTPIAGLGAENDDITPKLGNHGFKRGKDCFIRINPSPDTMFISNA